MNNSSKFISQHPSVKKKKKLSIILLCVSLAFLVTSILLSFKFPYAVWYITGAITGFTSLVAGIFSVASSVVKRFTALFWIIIIITSLAVSVSAQFALHNITQPPSSPSPEKPLYMVNLEELNPIYVEGKPNAEATAQGLFNAYEALSHEAPPSAEILQKLDFYIKKEELLDDTYPKLRKNIQQAKRDKDQALIAQCQDELDRWIQTAENLQNELIEEGYYDPDLAWEISLRYKEEVDLRIAVGDLKSGETDANKGIKWAFASIQHNIQQGKDPSAAIDSILELYVMFTNQNELLPILSPEDAELYGVWYKALVIFQNSSSDIQMKEAAPSTSDT